jgi:hypothetical protein
MEQGSQSTFQQTPDVHNRRHNSTPKNLDIDRNRK